MSGTAVQGFIDFSPGSSCAPDSYFLYRSPCCQYWFIKTSQDLRRLSLLLNTPLFGSDTAGNGSSFISLPLSRWMSSEMCREYLFREFVVKVLSLYISRNDHIDDIIGNNPPIETEFSFVGECLFLYPCSVRILDFP